jgi:histidinol-phosphate aminotransferase
VTPEHGGPDRWGVPRWDFSSGINALAPAERLRARVAASDAGRYPDPAYHALRAEVAARHGVAPHRILWAASASEFIQRITALAARLRPGAVAIPQHAYGDYARAARAHGLPVVACDDQHATLCWFCEPSSPVGGNDPPYRIISERVTVLDAVYEPLRLEGSGTWPSAARDAVFVLHGPNKALGLPGVRGAYAIAPAAPHWGPIVDALEAAAPSWPLGSQAVTMLHAWCEADTQEALEEQRALLRVWKAGFQRSLRAAGWDVRDGCTPFFLLGMPSAHAFTTLREQGIKLRDTTSFGLPGWARVNTLDPEAQHALTETLGALRARQG